MVQGWKAEEFYRSLVAECEGCKRQCRPSLAEIKWLHLKFAIYGCQNLPSSAAATATD